MGNGLIEKWNFTFRFVLFLLLFNFTKKIMDEWIRMHDDFMRDMTTKENHTTKHQQKMKKKRKKK